MIGDSWFGKPLVTWGSPWEPLTVHRCPPGIQWGSSPQQGPAMQKVQAFFAAKGKVVSTCFNHQ